MLREAVGDSRGVRPHSFPASNVSELCKHSRTNIFLHRILSRKPDIFCYGEALVSELHGMQLEGYKCYLHKSTVRDASNFRRGIAVFYLEAYEYSFFVEYTCPKFDLIWVRFTSGGEDVFLCFFYAPGDHLPEEVREEFFDTMSQTFSKFVSRGRIFMLGDSNTRLGAFLGDTDINGKYVLNKNAPHFFGFLNIPVCLY